MQEEYWIPSTPHRIMVLAQTYAARFVVATHDDRTDRADLELESARQELMQALGLKNPSDPAHYSRTVVVHSLDQFNLLCESGGRTSANWDKPLGIGVVRFQTEHIAAERFALLTPRRSMRVIT